MADKDVSGFRKAGRPAAVPLRLSRYELSISEIGLIESNRS